MSKKFWMPAFHELREKVTDFMGRKHYAYLTGLGAIVNGLGKVMCGREPTAHCFLVDDAKLNAARDGSPRGTSGGHEYGGAYIGSVPSRETATPGALGEAAIVLRAV